MKSAAKNYGCILRELMDYYSYYILYLFSQRL